MKNIKKDFVLKIVTLITFIIMIVVNALANILPINGITTGEVSDSYPNLFAPAGITFSIWGVIYFLLLLYTIYQLGIFQKKEDLYKEELFKRIGVLFSLSSVLNTIWILTWHYGIIWLSVLIMITILLLLISISNIIKDSTLDLKDKLLIKLPFSIYLGWITVATIANITAYLVVIGFTGFGLSESLWAMVIILVGLLISSLYIIREIDMAYGLPIIWAYIGIYLKHISNAGWNAKYPGVIFTVVAAILVLIAVEAYTLFNLRKDKIL